MEGNYPLNLSQRGFSREGGQRIPSRERQQNTPEVRKKLPTKAPLSVSGQNFFSQSQTFDSQSSTDDLMLASLNIAVDETAFISTTKADLLQLQEEINKMDMDGKIRNANPSSLLKKNHTYAMNRFLQKFANQNVKTWMDKRLSHATSFDTDDLLKFMGVTSESEGLRKLFKMLGVFDLMLLKMTEFHTVAFMKYDQVFESLRKQFGGQPPSKTSVMDTGITMSRFQPDLANMERFFELFGYVGKLSQQKKSTVDSKSNLDEKPSALKGIDSIEELYNRLKSGENLGFNSELVVNLLKIVEKSAEAKAKENSLEKRIRTLEKELNEKNSKLTTMVEFTANGNNDDTVKELEERIQQLQSDAESVRKELEAKFTKEQRARESELKEKNRKLEYESEQKDDQIKRLQEEVEKIKNQVTQNAVSSTPTKGEKDEVLNTDYYIKMIKQIEDNYQAKTKSLEDENYKKGQENVNLKTRLETAERERDDYIARLAAAEKQAEKDARARMGNEGESFEAALREQFTAMKEGFENKIKSLTLEIQQIKKDKSLEVLEVKRELTREKENRELLLRKLQIYTKT